MKIDMKFLISLVVVAILCVSDGSVSAFRRVQNPLTCVRGRVGIHVPYFRSSQFKVRTKRPLHRSWVASQQQQKNFFHSLREGIQGIKPPSLSDSSPEVSWLIDGEGDSSDPATIKKTINDLELLTREMSQSKGQIFEEDPSAEIEWKALLVRLTKVCPYMSLHQVRMAIISFARLRDPTYTPIINLLMERVMQILGKGESYFPNELVDIVWGLSRLNRRAPPVLYQYLRSFLSDINQVRTQRMKKAILLTRILFTLGSAYNRIDTASNVIGPNREAFVSTAVNAIRVGIGLSRPEKESDTLHEISSGANGTRPAIPKRLSTMKAGQLMELIWGISELELPLPDDIKTALFTALTKHQLSTYQINRMTKASHKLNASTVMKTAMRESSTYSRSPRYAINGAGKDNSFSNLAAQIKWASADRRAFELITSAIMRTETKREAEADAVNCDEGNESDRGHQKDVTGKSPDSVVKKANNRDTGLRVRVDRKIGSIDITPVTLTAVLSNLARNSYGRQKTLGALRERERLHALLSKLLESVYQLDTKRISTCLWALSRLNVQNWDTLGDQDMVTSALVKDTKDFLKRLQEALEIRVQNDEMDPESLSRSLLALSRLNELGGKGAGGFRTPNYLLQPQQTANTNENSIHDAIAEKIKSEPDKSKFRVNYSSKLINLLIQKAEMYAENTETYGILVQPLSSSKGPRSPNKVHNGNKPVFKVCHLKSVLESTARMSLPTPANCARVFSHLPDHAFADNTMESIASIVSFMSIFSRAPDARLQIEVYRRLLKHVTSNLSGVSPPQLANLVRILSSVKVGISNGDSQRIAERVLETASEFQAIDVSMFLQGFAMITTHHKYDHHDYYHESTEKRAGNDSTEGQHSDTAILNTSVQNMAFARLEKRCVEVQNHFTIMGIASTIHAFGRLKRVPRRETLDALLNKIPQQKQLLTPGLLGAILWGLANLHKISRPREYSEFSEQEIVDYQTIKTLEVSPVVASQSVPLTYVQSVDPGESAMTKMAPKHLDLWTSDSLQSALSVLFERVESEIADLNPPSVCHTLWLLSISSKPPDHLINLISHRIVSDIARYDGRRVSLVMAAFARMKIAMGASLRKALFRRSKEVLGQLDAYDIAVHVWSAGTRVLALDDINTTGQSDQDSSKERNLDRNALVIENAGVADVLKQLLERMDRVKIGPVDLMHVIWGVVVLRQQGVPELSKPLRDSSEIIDTTISRTIREGMHGGQTLNPQAISIVFWAWVSLKTQPSKDMFQLLVEAGERVVNKFSLQDSSLALWALTQLCVTSGYDAEVTNISQKLAQKLAARVEMLQDTDGGNVKVETIADEHDPSPGKDLDVWPSAT